MYLKYYVMLYSVHAVFDHSNQQSNFMKVMNFIEEM